MAPSGIDPAADEALAAGGAESTPLEARLIEEHLERSGLQRVAASAQAKAREVFRDDQVDTDGWVGQWRRAARHLSQLTADPEELKRAEEAFAEDMNEENLRRLQEILDRMRRETLESGTG
jgi:DNA primase